MTSARVDVVASDTDDKNRTYSCPPGLSCEEFLELWCRGAVRWIDDDVKSVRDRWGDVWARVGSTSTAWARCGVSIEARDLSTTVESTLIYYYGPLHEIPVVC